MYKLLYVGIGGFLGASARYLLSKAIFKLHPGAIFPYSTFVVNMLGCFVFGILFALTMQKHLISPELRLFLLVGFVGSFTTFSTYSFDSFYLINNSQFLLMALNILLQTGLGLLGVWLGYIAGVQL